MAVLSESPKCPGVGPSHAVGQPLDSRSRSAAKHGPGTTRVKGDSSCRGSVRESRDNRNRSFSDCADLPGTQAGLHDSTTDGEANVEFLPTMTPEDLRKAGLETIAKKWK
jgi:hypothetical protein